MVADATGPLPAGDDNGNLYLSVEGTIRAGKLTLNAVAVTAEPAMVLLADPAVDRLPENATFRMRARRPFDAALLERARGATRNHYRRTPILASNFQRAENPPAASSASFPGSRPTGQLWHGAPGRGIAVR
jgi:hypothetical protein